MGTGTKERDRDRDTGRNTSGLGQTLPGDAEPNASPSPSRQAGQIMSFYP